MKPFLRLALVSLALPTETRVWMRKEAEKIGIETTTCVRNICKYYTSYKLTLDAAQERGKAREQVIKK